MKKRILAIPLSIAGIALYAGLALAAETSPLADAIAKQLETAPQSIDMQAAPGYLGIPGGPQTNMLLAFGWALWVGWIFSTVGAFGGVMAGVGHMSVHGLGAYAKSFGQTPLNKSITDSVRASNQMLAGLSAALSTFSYYRLKRGGDGKLRGGPRYFSQDPSDCRAYTGGQFGQHICHFGPKPGCIVILRSIQRSQV